MTNQSQPRVLNNRFQLDRKLGQGGMATVYLGRDLRLGRPVAVKILHGQYAGDDQFLRRFKHEADAAAQLGHPNIVRVYDVGNDGDLHYIVMEYINGADLKEIISREAPLAIPRTLKLVQQIAEALEAAHRSGLVHRDVKPQNVLIDGEDQVHLSDFGIAKSDRSSAYTDPGTTFGTADYLAPEQAQGLGATARSDIYALGVVTYEMLTGRLPFAGDTPLAVAMQHVQAPPPAPRQFNPAIPPQLEAIVLQAMAKDPAQRPASARAFAELLRTYRERGNQQTTVSPAVPPAVPPRTGETVVMDPNRIRPPRPAQQQAPPPQQRRPVPPPLQHAPPPQQAYAPEPQRRSGGCGVFVLGLLLFAGLAGLLYAIFFTDLVPTIQSALGGGNQAATAAPTAPAATPTGALVRLPRLLGLDESAARQQISELKLLENLEEPVNDPAPRGTVIKQEPAENAEIPEGSVVTIQLSLGPAAPAKIQVGDLTGQRFDAVAPPLQAQGLNVVRTDAPNPAPAGTILAQQPGPGELDAGATLQLTVSAGDVVAFPPVVGLSRDRAEDLLNEAGLSLDVVDEQGPDRLPNFDAIPPNQVVSATANGNPVQNGQFVPRGSIVVLGVRRP